MIFSDPNQTHKGKPDMGLTRFEFLQALKRLFAARLSEKGYFIQTIDDEILLRQLELTERDIEALETLVSHEKAYLKQWLDGHTWEQLLKARRYIDQSLMYQWGTGSIDAGIWYRQELAGIVTLRRGFITMERIYAAIGYWLGRTYQGKGIATRSVAVMVDYAFGVAHFGDVRIQTWEKNEKSRALAERLGFRLEQIVPNAVIINGNVVNEAVYVKMREIWKARRNS